MSIWDPPQMLLGNLSSTVLYLTRLERRGVHVHAGDRVKLQLVHDQERTDEQTAAWNAFIGSFTIGDPDFAERSEEILRAEFRW
jgi:hypothetical protein